MSPVDPWEAELAAILARSVGGRGVVCVGCLPDVGEERSLITLARPPLNEPFVGLDRVLLLVACSGYDPSGAALSAAPEVWLYDEAEEFICTLSRPIHAAYRRRSLILPGDRVRLVALPEVDLVPIPAG